jgi:hypothetical protein
MIQHAHVYVCVEGVRRDSSTLVFMSMCAILNSLKSRTQLEIKECRNKTKIQAKTANIANLKITEVRDTGQIVNSPNCLDLSSSFTYRTQHQYRDKLMICQFL